MKETTFKMTGFPQHAGVSPVKQTIFGTKGILPKAGKFLAKHPKINERVKKLKTLKNNTLDKINKFAKTDAGKAVIAGLTEKATAPRPKKEITAIISGEQKSIM